MIALCPGFNCESFLSMVLYKTTLGHYELFTNFEIVSSKSKVYFLAEGVSLSFPQKAPLKKMVEEIFTRERIMLQRMNYVFCTDERLLEINKRYLHHDYLTDIITFDLSEKKGQVFGESYISIERVSENAIKLKSPLSKEIWRVVFHGALHLCGYADKTEKEKRQIRSKEDYYISLFEQTFHVK